MSPSNKKENKYRVAGSIALQSSIRINLKNPERVSFNKSTPWTQSQTETAQISFSLLHLLDDPITNSQIDSPCRLLLNIILSVVSSADPTDLYNAGLFNDMGVVEANLKPNGQLYGNQSSTVAVFCTVDTCV